MKYLIHTFLTLLLLSLINSCTKYVPCDDDDADYERMVRSNFDGVEIISEPMVNPSGGWACMQGHGSIELVVLR